MKSILTFLLGLTLCLSAVGADKDKEEFEKTKAQAEKGDQVAQYNLRLMYRNGGGVPQDDKEAVKWFRKAAEQGRADAQLNLGVMYAKGEGVPQDFKEAVKWNRKAAEQGHCLSQAVLGLMYRYGEGVLEDDVTAYAWINIAAANGDAIAKKNKDILVKEMTADQIVKAEVLAKEMIAKTPKLIKKP